jgi:hypothetical protein
MGRARTVAVVVTLVVTTGLSYVAIVAMFNPWMESSSIAYLARLLWYAAGVLTCGSAIVMLFNGPVLGRAMGGFALFGAVSLLALGTWSAVDAPRVAAMPYPNGASFIAGMFASVVLPAWVFLVGLLSLLYVTGFAWSLRGRTREEQA